MLWARSLGIDGVFQSPAEPSKCPSLPWSCISTLLRQFSFLQTLRIDIEEGKHNGMIDLGLLDGGTVLTSYPIVI